MSIVGRIKDWLGLGEQRGTSLDRYSFGGAFQPSNQLVPLNEQNALCVSALLCGVNVISDAIAGLPLYLFRKTAQGKEQATDHPVYDLLLHSPNEDMTAFTYRHTCQHHALLWGESISEIVWDNAGRPVSLYPVLPQRTRVQRDAEGRLVYHITGQGGGGTQTLDASQVLHIPGLSYEGIRGIALIFLARQALELSRHSEEFAASFFRQGSRPSGALSYPGRLTDVARENLRTSWQRLHGGPANTGSVPILEEGLAWTPMDVSAPDEALQAVRSFQVFEVARILNIPPPYLHDLSRATFANLDNLAVQFVNQTLSPWLRRWEAEIRRKLLSPREQSRYWAEFDTHKLLQGDISKRYEVYSTALQNGILSRNEVRALEGLNDIGPDGDEYTIQVNLHDLSEPPPEPAPPQQQPEPDTDDKEDSGKTTTEARYQSDGNRLVGYAAVWDSPTTIRERGRQFVEIIRRGAFAASIGTDDVVANFGHDDSRLLGRTSSGTLQLSEDAHGLRFSLDLPEHAADIREMVARGDLSGASFAFDVVSDKWSETRDRRELLQVRLYDVAVVVRPANEATTVGLRAKGNPSSLRLDLLRRLLDSKADA